MSVWSQSTSPEIASAVTRPGEGAAIALLPVGAVEQHGPHLPTGTDSIIATAIASAAAERTGALLLPTVAVGASYGHGATFPGTLSLRPELLADVVRDHVRWVAVSGGSSY